MDAIEEEKKITILAENHLRFGVSTERVNWDSGLFFGEIYLAFLKINNKQGQFRVG